MITDSGFIERWQQADFAILLDILEPIIKRQNTFSFFFFSAKFLTKPVKVAAYIGYLCLKTT